MVNLLVRWPRHFHIYVLFVTRKRSCSCLSQPIRKCGRIHLFAQLLMIDAFSCLWLTRSLRSSGCRRRAHRRWLTSWSVYSAQFLIA